MLHGESSFPALSSAKSDELEVGPNVDSSAKREDLDLVVALATGASSTGELPNNDIEGGPLAIRSGFRCYCCLLL